MRAGDGDRGLGASGGRGEAVCESVGGAIGWKRERIAAAKLYRGKPTDSLHSKRPG